MSLLNLDRAVFKPDPGPAPRRPARRRSAAPVRRRPLTAARHVLAVTVTADGAGRLLLLAESTTGTVRVCRARIWSARATVGTVLAAVGAAYRAAAEQTPPATVHLAYAVGTWPTLIRRAVGPLAALTIDTAPAAEGWPCTVRLALAALGLDPAEDPEQAAILVEHAITRTGGE